MEKYYLTRLTNLPEDIEPKKRVKFIEIHYERKPQSFGIVYLAKAEASNGFICFQLRLNALELTNNNNARLNIVKKVDLITKKYDESSLLSKSSIVDFDSINIIKMDDDLSTSSVSPSAQQRKKVPQTILLQEDGNLLSINLVDSTIKSLTNYKTNNNNNIFGIYLQCKIQQQSIEFDESIYYVHLLTEKYYLRYKLLNDDNKSLELNQKYNLKLNDKRKFVKFYIIEHLKSSLIIIKLNDNSLQFVNNSTCLYNFNSSMINNNIINNFDLVPILGGPSDEAIVMIVSKTHMNCYSLQLNEFHSSSISRQTNKNITNEMIDEQQHVTNRSSLEEEDPDNLLPKQPSFEFEHCWSIDLNDIDCIRALEEEDDYGQNNNHDDASNNNNVVDNEPSKNYNILNCCPMWSTNQLVADSNWPKFLLVTYKYHLLVYSFEQQPVLPFSVVYDKSFLEILSMQNQEKQNVGSKNKSDAHYTNNNDNFHEYIDTKSKPKLIHNFKLIGSQSTDSLFNTLFLVAKSNLIRSRFFIHLRILLTVSDSGDIFLFKFTSTKIINQKDNVYQQLILDSIKGGQLLKDQLELLQKNNLLLNENIQNLVSKSNTSNKHLNDFVLDDNLSDAKLIQSNQFGCLYNLNISLSNLIQVEKILIISSVDKCHIIKPDTNLTSSTIESIEIDNNCTTNKNHRPILLSNVILDDKSNIEKLILDKKEKKEEFLRSWAVLKLYYNRPKNVNITLPIYISDRQSGTIKIFLILDNNHCMERPVEKNMLKSLLVLGKLEIQPITRFYSIHIHIKPLMSYQFKNTKVFYDNNNYLDNDDSNMIKLVIDGDFNRQKMLDWLKQLINIDEEGESESSKYNCRLFSAFTCCSIGYQIEDGRMTISCDDVFVLELIKKSILKQATNESKKIQISNQIQPTLNNLRYLIENQFVNIQNLNSDGNNSRQFELLQHKCDKSNKAEWLIESLFDEINLDDLPMIKSNNSMNLLEFALKEDIEKIMNNKDSKTFDDLKRENSLAKYIKLDVIRTLIIESVVDYYKLQGVQISDDFVSVMKQKITQIVDNVTNLQSITNKISFTDKILNECNTAYTKYCFEKK